MNKTLLICFITVSAVALVVSSAAVMTTARVYHMGLYSSASDDTDGCGSDTEESLEPDESTLSESTDTEPPDVSDTTAAEFFDENSRPAVSDTEASAMPDPGVLLRLVSGKLTVTDPSGAILYERSVDHDSLNPRDTVALTEGIAFPDAESAVSAIYDLVS